MNNDNLVSQIVGETTDVEVWLSRAGLRFEDLGKDEGSVTIRKQWREYQAAVHRCCVALGQTPAEIQLSGVYANLRIPSILATKELSRT